MPLKLNPDELPTINLTSMIDVVFLLLIFFMVGTRFSDNEQSIAVELTRISAAGSTTKPALSKTINLYRDGGIELDNRRMSLAEVSSMLNNIVRTQPQLDVVIRPDSSVPIQQVTEVMEAVLKAGVQRTPRIAVSGQSKLSR